MCILFYFCMLYKVYKRTKAVQLYYLDIHTRFMQYFLNLPQKIHNQFIIKKNYIP